MSENSPIYTISKKSPHGLPVSLASFQHLPLQEPVEIHRFLANRIASTHGWGQEYYISRTHAQGERRGYKHLVTIRLDKESITTLRHGSSPAYPTRLSTAYWERRPSQKLERRMRIRPPAMPLKTGLTNRDMVMSNYSRGLSNMTPQDFTRYMLFGEKPRSKSKAKRGWGYVLQSLIHQESPSLYNHR